MEQLVNETHSAGVMGIGIMLVLAIWAQVCTAIITSLECIVIN